MAPVFRSEDELTAWLARRAEKIGDDAAFLPPLGETAVTVDSQREGIHFRPGTAPGLVAERLVAVNVSDLAAVGAKPRYCLCTLAASPAYDRQEFFETLLSSARSFGMELVGGDLAASDRVECTLTAIGTRRARGRFLRRSGARPGDQLWLSGSLGLSGLGLQLLDHAEVHWRGRSRSLRVQFGLNLPPGLERAAMRAVECHLRPVPQIEVSRYLAQRRATIAAIDLSDGLWTDAKRLAQVSRVGFEFDFSELESAHLASSRQRDFGDLCEALDVDPKVQRLLGGEDYSLLFTAPPEMSKALHRLVRDASIPLARLGQVVEERQGLQIVSGTRRQPLGDVIEAAGRSPFDHLTGGLSS